MASIITPTADSAASADFTLAAASTTLCLSGSVRPLGSAQIQRKVGTDYFTVGELTSGMPAQVLNATGTFRVIKGATATAFGVDRD